MERSLPWDQDPASPGLAPLVSLAEELRQQFFSVQLTSKTATALTTPMAAPTATSLG